MRIIDINKELNLSLTIKDNPYTDILQVIQFIKDSQSQFIYQEHCNNYCMILSKRALILR